jgi:hypothetical protein
MTNREINAQMKCEVSTERKATLRILNLINLAEAGKLALEFGFESTHEWLIKEHNYSGTSADRRVQAARLLKVVPAASKKLETGALNLMVMTKAQSMIRVQEKKGKVTRQEKAAAISKIENLSVLKAEQALMALFPANISQVKRDHITVIDQNTQRLSVNLSNQAIADLQRSKEILSHVFPSGQASLVLERVLSEYVKHADPLNKKTTTVVAQSITNLQSLQRDNGACTFISEETGRVCGSRYQVQRDHIIPLALGGDDSPENARTLCRKHNLLMAEKILGKILANCWRAEYRSF